MSIEACALDLALMSCGLVCGLLCGLVCELPSALRAMFITAVFITAVIALYAACRLNLVASSDGLLALHRSTSDDATQQVMIVLDEGRCR